MPTYRTDLKNALGNYSSKKTYELYMKMYSGEGMYIYI